jgi:hypothetical protein
MIENVYTEKGVFTVDIESVLALIIPSEAKAPASLMLMFHNVDKVYFLERDREYRARDERWCRALPCAAIQPRPS